VFPVRYEPGFYMLCRRNSIFKGLILQMYQKALRSFYPHLPDSYTLLDITFFFQHPVPKLPQSIVFPQSEKPPKHKIYRI
jgi:hypothetical protein